MQFKIGASGRGKSSLPPEIVEAHMWLDEYRHALVDGLGDDGRDYKIACIPNLAGITNVGCDISQ